MTTPLPVRRLLLAGSHGPERRPARPDPTEPRWFEPLHVRDVRGARERLADQVAAGADVIVAPTWQTHRRALLGAGETRRAREWTMAALRIGREAIEVGMERRDEASPERDGREGEAGSEPGSPSAPVTRSATDPLSSSAVPRPIPLLGASLPGLDEAPDPGLGRLLPRAAASERDYRDQAGLLADAGPDVILVEGQASPSELRTAVGVALETGLPVWLAMPPSIVRESGAASIVGTLDGLSVACLLLPGGPPDADPGPLGADLLQLGVSADWGAQLDRTSRPEPWLDAGAAVLACLDGASPERLMPLRAAIDEFERAVLEKASRADDAWWAHVRRAASMTEGGAALWLLGASGASPAAEQLPDGFAWVAVSSDEAGALPTDRFRLIVDPDGDQGDARPYARWLAHGGLLVSRGLPRAGDATGLQTFSIDDTEEPPVVIARREA